MQVMCSELAASASDAASKTKLGRKLQDSESGKVCAAKHVGKATISGTLAILEELHKAALVLVAQVADSSADLAHFKYGDEVGHAAEDVAHIVKDGANVVLAVHELGLKQMAAHVVAEGVVDVMSTDEEKAHNRQQRRLKDMQGVDPGMQAAASVAKAMAVNEMQQQQAANK